MGDPAVSVEARPEIEHSFRAMASTVRVRILDPGPEASEAIQRVVDVFDRVERECTRFDPASPLMIANAAGRRSAPVPETCLEVVREALVAYRETDGLFDPRTLESLTALGYDRSLAFERGPVETRERARRRFRVRQWRPRIDPEAGRIRIGPRPIDLGGIGKGYAVRRALGLLRGHGVSALVEAGGDLATFGPGPQAPEWRASVESPFGTSSMAAVLDVTARAVATSSIRLRTWQAGGRRVHHLIDPRTGEPADSGLRSVTVLGRDAAWAEVWSKALFIVGAAEIRRFAEERRLAAMWIRDDGRVQASRDLVPSILWRVSRVD